MGDPADFIRYIHKKEFALSKVNSKRKHIHNNLYKKQDYLFYTIIV
jgi:hypothetical protein